MRMKVFVAMSGGVDSSVAAALLKKQGHDATGVTMRLTDDMSVEAAAQTAKILAIPHEVIDFRERFKTTVIDAFAEAYKKGLTPNPCVICNFAIKFGALLDYALANGADKLATGHYARIASAQSEKSEIKNKKSETCFHLLKGLDVRKDQSYFIYRLNQEKLRHLLFPLGEKTKDEVRKIAGELGLPADERDESQDVCFIPDGDYQTYLEQPPGLRAAKGPIVDLEGRVIGEHDGIHTVTVGQRKGLGIAAAEPLYVLKIDAANNRVVVASREAVFRDSVNVTKIFWTAGAPPAEEFNAGVKIRYNSTEAPVTVKVTGVESANIVFEGPQFAPAPGQSAVIYDGAEVLGGGVIV